jgi:hypothetical protein
MLCVCVLAYFTSLGFQLAITWAQKQGCELGESYYLAQTKAE